MSATVNLLTEHRAAILEIAARHGARNVRVFGSFARGEATEHSDLDLLVEMDSDRSLLDTIGLIQDLEERLNRKVDVLTEKAIYWMLKDRILQEAKAL